MSRKNTLKIGNAGGYWGDDPSALKRQVAGGKLDYITMDFLAEVTMSILQKQQAKDPNLGYARDFIPMIAGVLPEILKNKTRVITNAGGINPEACAAAIVAEGRKLGLNPKVAVVHGDDILGEVKALQQQGTLFKNMETGDDFSSVENLIEAANIYFGAAPVVEALKKWQPDIIVTGRVTDTGITVAPMIYEFGWDLKDWNKIAAGIIAGHMLECGCQITGGNFSDWNLVDNYNQMGYPIAEVEPDGQFVLSKHEGSGGYVSEDTVREQLFYEMGNPKAYLTPDVVADFSSIKLAQIGKDRVQVDGIKGHEPTPLYKVSMAYEDGYKCIGSILISGPNAREKAKAFADIFWKRCDQEFTQKLTEFVGHNACHRSLGQDQDPNEIILRLGARSHDFDALRTFAKMIPSLILSGPPGVAVLGGVPKVQTVVSYWPALIDKALASPKIALFEDKLVEEATVSNTQVGQFKESLADVQQAERVENDLDTILTVNSNPNAVPLYDICLARSGDKGDSANIGILARSEAAYEFIKEHLTAQVIKDLFQELCEGRVRRYCLDNLFGLNFILDQSLGGGGSCTLRSDAQGKTFSQAILRQRFLIPKNIVESCKR
ncbi:MAG: acyclic terpene utilization AtuA family protein [Oligoflexales bacterium]